MKNKIISFVLVISVILSLFSVMSSSAFAANKSDMFFNLAFGLSQSGHIEQEATNYYKFSLDSYTTFTIDYDTSDESEGYHYGELEVFKTSDYNNRDLGKDYKTYFSANTIDANNDCTYFDGKMSLYAGTYYLALRPLRSWNGDGSNNYTITVTPTVIKSTKVGFSSTSSSVKVNWTADLGSTGYQVQRKTGGSYKTLTKTDDTYYNDKELSSATVYEYRVRGYVTINDINYYGAWKYLTAVTKPGATVIKTPSTNSKHKITAKWKKVSSCTGYQVQFCKNKKFTSGVTSKYVSGKSNTSYTASKFTKGKTYYIRVRSYKTLSGKKYYGAWSKVKSIKCK